MYETFSGSLFQPVQKGYSISSKMAAAVVASRWLDILEQEFDKAFVDVDMLFGEIDPDQVDLTLEGREKMTALSAAFAQLIHKYQTIFQSNAKLEVSLCSIMFFTIILLVFSFSRPSY